MTVQPLSPPTTTALSHTVKWIPEVVNNNISSKKTRREHFLEWSLLVFLATAIVWVCVFTIYGPHTDLVKKQVYPFFESTYFEDKEGARIFTYLGVLYLFPGIITLWFMARGIVELPYPPLRITQKFKLPQPISMTGNSYWSILELLVILVFVAVQVLTFASRVINRFDEYWIPERVWYEISKTLGKTLALTLSVMLLPVSKNCFWLDILNYKFERALKFHKWIGWFFVVVLIVHAGTAITSLIMADQFGNCMWPNSNCEKPGGWSNYKGLETSWIITYGWISFAVLCPLIITSLPWFRRHRFEQFYYIHIAIFLPFMIIIHLHYKGMIYYSAPGLAAYTLDKVVWWLSTRRPGNLLMLSSPAPGFVRMEIAVDLTNQEFEPGAWVQIRVPAISKWQWHPMSIASCPGRSTITIDIKVVGDWTSDLERFSKRFDPTQPAHTCVYVDQYQGSSHSRYQGFLNNHPVVLMFGGGIGITPMVSAMRDILQHPNKYPHIRRVVFLWCVKKKSCLKLYEHELKKIQSLIKNPSPGCCEVQLRVNVTLSEPELGKNDQEENSFRRSRSIQTVESDKKQEPIKKYVFGYMHNLILSVGAGCGVLLGVFAANVLAYGKSWHRYEYQSMLQLLLSSLFGIILVGMCMSGTFLSPSNSNAVTASAAESDDSEKTSLNSQTIELSTSMSIHEEHATKAGPISIDADAETGEINVSKVPDEETNVLHVTLGKRPNIPRVVKETRNYCLQHNFRSVGVSVCGPDAMVDSVFDAVRKNAGSFSSHSINSVQFIVDDEAFEW